MFSFSLSLFLAMALLSGCDMKMPPMPWDKPAPKAESAETPPPDSGGAEEMDLAEVEAALLPPAMKNLPYEEVELPMRDRLVIYGRLYVPGMKPEGDQAVASATDAADENAPKHPLVILLHGLSRNHQAWNDLPATLVKAGYAVLALDLRGHGKSTRTVGGRRVTWRFFTKEQWRDVPADIASVIRTFTQGEDYPQVDGHNVALIGEKLGANVAVLAAQENLDTVKAMALISPGLDYKGLTPSQAILDFHHPVLLLTSLDDDYANRSTHGLYNWILEAKTLQEYGRIGDGSDMLIGRPAIGESIRDWLLKTLPAPDVASGT